MSLGASPASVHLQELLQLCQQPAEQSVQQSAEQFVQQSVQQVAGTSASTFSFNFIVFVCFRNPCQILITAKKLNDFFSHTLQQFSPVINVFFSLSKKFAAFFSHLLSLSGQFFCRGGGGDKGHFFSRVLNIFLVIFSEFFFIRQSYAIFPRIIPTKVYIQGVRIQSVPNIRNLYSSINNSSILPLKKHRLTNSAICQSNHFKNFNCLCVCVYIRDIEDSREKEKNRICKWGDYTWYSANFLITAK